MEALQEMFPTAAVHILRQALENSDSVEDAVLRLIDIEPPEENNIPPDPAPLGGSPPPFEDVMDIQGQDEDDAVQVPLGKQQKADERPKFPGLDDSLAQVVSVFPDVCTHHVKKVYRENVVHQGHNIVDYILDSLIEMGTKYPRTETENPRKRKRPVEENIYESIDREKPPDGYKSIARRLLQREFPVCPATYIDRVLQDNFLAQSYAAIVSVYDDLKPPFDRLKNPRKLDDGQDTLSKVYLELVEELKYAKGKAKEQKHNAQLEADAKLAVSLDIEEHEENGMMIECQCCYGESPFSGMTQCNEGHLFCLDCARRNAENEVGRGRYRLLCMAGCKSEFPRREIRRFLDEKLILALEKNEQEEVLRMADLEDLTKCPFCDYAAICAPIEEDKEFRCRNPDCLEISCRYCQQKSHIPLTCEEVSKDGKLSIRHKLEEAMTDALVRTCKKCRNKFIKESGCNKMACSRCHTLQCYVCSETIKGYDHFNDPSRGGSKTNKCPLFDNTDERHDEEVEKAAKLVMEQLKEENPHITDEDLEIKISEAAKRKKAVNPPGMPRIPPGEDAALFGFHQPRLTPPPVIPPIHRLIPPAQLVPPPAQPVAHGGFQAQLQGLSLREQAAEYRRLTQLHAFLAQDRARLQRAGAVRQQAPSVLPAIQTRSAAGRITGNPVQPLAGLSVNPIQAAAVQAAAAQAAQAIPVPLRMRRPVRAPAPAPVPAPAPAPAPTAPPSAVPMAPWRVQNPAPIQGNSPASRFVRLQDLQQRYPAFHFADRNFPMLFYGPDQAAAAAGGDVQAAAAAPGGYPAAAAGQNTPPNQPPAAGGLPPVWSSRRRTT